MTILFVSIAGLSSPKAQNIENIKWVEGPGDGKLGDIATIRFPSKYIFADGNDTRTIMEAMHNPPSGNELGFLAPEDSDWFLVFEYSKTGYIKDDEKNSLNADEMLKQIKKGNEAGNRERAKRGWPPLNITGWKQPPRYNPITNNLEWAIMGESEGKAVINWNTRILGRNGVMKVTLVSDPVMLDEILPYQRTLLSGYSYNSGQRYAEYRQGDKVAEYGLSALVVGGATAVAAKTGILKSLWKFLAAGAIAALVALKKIFSRKPKNVA
jgi:uncharacterized membrane-anchored protein